MICYFNIIGYASLAKINLFFKIIFPDQKLFQRYILSNTCSLLLFSVSHLAFLILCYVESLLLLNFHQLFILIIIISCYVQSRRTNYFWKLTCTNKFDLTKIRNFHVLSKRKVIIIGEKNQKSLLSKLNWKCVGDNK